MMSKILPVDDDHIEATQNANIAEDIATDRVAADLARANGPDPVDRLGVVIRRLQTLLRHENALLTSNRFEELPILAADKHRLLTQLSLCQNDFDADNAAPGHHLAMRELKMLLEENVKLLKFHVDAISELSMTMEEAMRQADSDGTYSL